MSTEPRHKCPTCERTSDIVKLGELCPFCRASPAAAVPEGALPPLPPNVAHVTRRIRRCEGDTAAQLVLEHFAMEYARAAVEADRARQQDMSVRLAGAPAGFDKDAWSEMVGEVAELYGRLLAEKQRAHAAQGRDRGTEYYIADGIGWAVGELQRRCRAQGGHGAPEAVDVSADRAQQGEPVACPVCAEGVLIKQISHYCNACGTDVASPADIKANLAATKAPAPDAPKDHEIREAINQLRDIAVQFHATQQLRDRIADIVLPLVKGAAPVPDTGIPTAGDVTFDAWFEEWRRSTWKPLPSDIANGRAACPEHWNTNPRRHMGIAWSAARRAPVSGTPTDKDQA